MEKAPQSGSVGSGGAKSPSPKRQAPGSHVEGTVQVGRLVINLESYSVHWSTVGSQILPVTLPTTIRRSVRRLRAYHRIISLFV